jgi:hypothetical protein
VGKKICGGIMLILFRHRYYTNVKNNSRKKKGQKEFCFCICLLTEVKKEKQWCDLPNQYD